MPFEDIDDALRRQPMWEPPAGFGRQVATIAMRLPAQSDHVTGATALTTAWHTVGGLVAGCRATVSGYTWMVRQYWALLAR